MDKYLKKHGNDDTNNILQKREALDPTLSARIEPNDTNHNEGQPVQVELDGRGQQRSKFHTDCEEERKGSLKCIMDNYENKQLCEPFFDVYRDCKRREQERRLEKNARESAAAAGGDSCVIS